MPRHEADREDLMREATALRERVEMSVLGELEPVVAGFRDDGRLSLYFGADPVFHFDHEGRLRRAYSRGDLYRSQGSTLARLRRTRTEAGTTLHRHDLDSGELEQFLNSLRTRLTALLTALKSQRVDVRREFPAEAGIGPRLIKLLPPACEGRLAPALKK